MKKFRFSIKALALAFCMIAFAPACTDLEEELFDTVTADNFFQTEEELISALGAAYTSLYSLMSNDQLACTQEVTSDAMVVPTRGPDWGDGGVWTQLHEHEWNS
ncbi:MAG: RagB/SusD family nutrient uptake outer membrane protein, partial [Bacteroidota bacterium]